MKLSSFLTDIPDKLKDCLSRFSWYIRTTWETVLSWACILRHRWYWLLPCYFLLRCPEYVLSVQLLPAFPYSCLSRMSLWVKSVPRSIHDRDAVSPHGVHMPLSAVRKLIRHWRNNHLSISLRVTWMGIRDEVPLATCFYLYHGCRSAGNDEFDGILRNRWLESVRTGGRFTPD